MSLSVSGSQSEVWGGRGDDAWSETGRGETTTDDTSVHETDQLKDVQHQLEDRLQGIKHEDSPEAEDLQVEKDHMEHQLRMVKAQMKRMIDARSRGETDLAAMDFEPVIYSARQLRLIRKVLDKWRAHRAFSMAEAVLSSAVLIKEANIIRYGAWIYSVPTFISSFFKFSQELRKNVSFNFTIAAGGSLAAPASAVDTIAGLDEFGDVSDPILAGSTQPSVAVKVLDKKHNAIYSWSLDRMQQQVQKMRNLTTYIDRPSYTQHFSSDEPFYDSPPPEYSFIGNALLSLAPLARRLSSTSILPIFCRYTAEAIGSCRIEVKIVNFVLPSKYVSTPSTRASSPSTSGPSTGLPKIVPAGTKIGFFVTVDSVKGLTSLDFASVHLQVRLSSFVGSSIKAEEVFPSTAIDLEASTLSDLKFRRNFTIVATSKVLAHLKNGYAPIEFFAHLRPSYIERMERWDEMREAKVSFPRPNSADPEGGDEKSEEEKSTLPYMRRAETDFVVQQSHDIVAWVQVCELGPDGNYAPVPVVLSKGGVDPGSFTLHQGLQRRLIVTMSSNSGKQFPWIEITKVRVGNVRVVDSQGRVYASDEERGKTMVTVPLLKDQVTEFRADGTGLLRAECLWDSSVHDSQLLNRVTAANQRVLVQLSWGVSVETCADPVQFTADVGVTMGTRDSRGPSRFMNFIGGNRVVGKTSYLFSVKLSPPMTRNTKELWRLDTKEKYVRGEEVLTSWKPRGISVVEDYERLVSTERRAADVSAIRVVLGSFKASVESDGITDPDSMAWRADGLLRKSVDLWAKRFGHRDVVGVWFHCVNEKLIFQQRVLSQDPTEDDEPPTSSKKRMEEELDGIKLISETKLIAQRYVVPD